MSRAFTINDNSLNFSFALVMQNPTPTDAAIHPANDQQQPYFQYQIIDNSDGTTLFEKHIVSNPNNSIFLQKHSITLDCYIQIGYVKV